MKKTYDFEARFSYSMAHIIFLPGSSFDNIRDDHRVILFQVSDTAFYWSKPLLVIRPHAAGSVWLSG